MERYNEGELVLVQEGKRVLPSLRLAKSRKGEFTYRKIPALILKVIERNDQNPEWDKYLVMVEDCVDAVTSRCLQKI